MKELDKAIEIVEVPQSEEIKDLQLGEDSAIDLEETITRQADHHP